MRAGLLLLLLGGCQLVFELEPATIEVRGFSSAAGGAPTASITIPRPQELVAGDAVVAMIRQTRLDPNILIAPAGWSQLAELTQPCGDGENWRGWVVSAIATDELSFDFAFDEEIATHTVLAIAYRNASSVTFVEQDQLDGDQLVATLPSAMATVGSQLLLAGLAGVPWTEVPMDFSRPANFENLAFYDQRVAQAAIPALAIPVATCGRIVQLTIDP